MPIIDDEESDARQYAALEAEDEAASDGPVWSNPAGFRDDEGGDDGGADVLRESKAESPEDDGEAVERAALLADEAEYEMRENYSRQQQQPRRDIYDDPIGALQEVREHQARERSQADYRQFVSEVEKHENTFRAMTPDYNEAVEHLEKARRSELAKLYPDSSPQAHLIARQHGFRTPADLRNAVFVNDAQTVARQSLMAGKNPAKTYYELAEDRGWRPKGGGRSSGRSSGGRSAGGRSAGGMSVDKLNDLYVTDPEEFDRQWDKAARSGRFG